MNNLLSVRPGVNHLNQAYPTKLKVWPLQQAIGREIPETGAWGGVG